MAWASSVRSRCTPRRSTRSRSLPAAGSGARSCTTCATCAARPPGSASGARSRPRSRARAPRLLPGRLNRRALLAATGWPSAGQLACPRMPPHAKGDRDAWCRGELAPALAVWLMQPDDQRPWPDPALSAGSAEVAGGTRELPAADQADEPAADQAEVAAPGAGRAGRSLLVELPVLIVVALLVALLIKTFVVQAF